VLTKFEGGELWSQI